VTSLIAPPNLAKTPRLVPGKVSAGEDFNRLTRLAARSLSAPISLIALIEDEQFHIISGFGLEGGLAEQRDMPRGQSICQHLLGSSSPLVINDALSDTLACGSLLVKDFGVRSYLGFPLRTADGFVVGSFCVMGVQVRAWHHEEIAVMQDFSELAIAQLAAHHAGVQRHMLVERLEKISARLPGVIYQYRLRPDGTSCFPYASEGIRKIYGVAPEDVIDDASSVLALLHPDDREALSASMRLSAERLETWRLEYRICFPDGTERWLLGESVPEREVDGSTLWHGFTSDVTLRKHADQRLRAALEQVNRQHFALDLHSIVAMTDLDGVIVQANRKFQELCGYAEEELIGQTYRLVNSGVHPEAFFQEIFATLVAGKAWRGDICSRSRSGALYWVATTMAPFYDQEGRPQRYVIIQTDITSQKRAAAELLQANGLLEAILDSTDYVVVASDLAGVITRLNRAGEDFLDYRLEEVVGRYTLAQWHDPAELATRAAALTTELGRTVSPGLETLIAKARQTGAPDHHEWTLIRRDGARFPANLSVTCLRDTRGGVNGYLGVIQDLSLAHKIAADRASLDQKIAATAKLESLGVLAGGIAHDFNNILTAVLGNASLLRNSLEHQAANLALVEQIEQSSRRAADLCKQMLAYSGRGRFVIQPVNLNQIIRDTTRLLEISMGKHCVLRFRLTDPLPPVEADATQIRQILINLITNASEAIAERDGVIAIDSGITHANCACLRSMANGDTLKEGDYVFIEISDNGSGMLPDDLARIFDPFFSTKFIGRGLGLAAVLGIVRGHKGAVKVYSEAGKGSTFRLLFPCLSSCESPAPPAEPVKVENWRGSGTVLVADDEEGVRVLTACLLEHMGFSVELACDGREAVDMFSAHPQKYALVLLDLTMPHLDGEEVFRRIHHLRPDVRVILISGYNRQEVMTRFAGKGVAGFLQKPFEIKDFEKKVQAILTAA